MSTSKDLLLAAVGLCNPLPNMPTISRPCSTDQEAGWHLRRLGRRVVSLDGLEVEARQVVQSGGTHAGDGDVQGAQPGFQAADDEGEGAALAAGDEAQVVVAEALQHDEVGLAHFGVSHDVRKRHAQRHLEGDVQRVLLMNLETHVHFTSICFNLCKSESGLDNRLQKEAFLQDMIE